MNRQLNVLLLEDVPQDAELVERALSEEGLNFKARRVASKQEFARAIRDGQCDIILADYHLPQFNALEALQLIQEQQREVPFIVVTCSQSDEVAAECIKRGADDYVLKTNLKRLPAAVMNALDKQQAARARADAIAALRRSETLYRLITENTGDLVCLLGRIGTFLYASPSYRMSLGYAPESLIGRSAASLVHPDDVAAFHRAFLQGTSARECPKSNVRFKHHSGEWRIFESVGTAVVDERGNPQSVVIVSRDVTERQRTAAQLKTSHEQLRALSARVHAILESEKTRIAREIHDDFAQKLTALVIEFSLLDSGFGDTGHELPPKELRAKIKNLCQLTDGMIKAARRLEAQLRPKVLDEFGLAAALEWQTREFAKETGLKCEFTAVPEDFALERDLATELFRIFQEILSNVARHANASRVTVRVEEQAEELILEVRDNGRGVTAEQMASPKSLGLLGMKERASLFDGAVHIEGAPGNGTRVRVTAPVKRPQASPAGSARQDEMIAEQFARR